MVQVTTPLLLVLLALLALFGHRAYVLAGRTHTGPEWFERTRTELVVLHNTVSEAFFQEGRWPTTLDEVMRWHHQPGEEARLDAWGRPYVVLAPFPCGCDGACTGGCAHGGPVCLGTLGSDGAPGGTGAARDRWTCDLAARCSPD
jgi:hypothetical protein